MIVSTKRLEARDAGLWESCHAWPCGRCRLDVSNGKVQPSRLNLKDRIGVPGNIRVGDDPITRTDGRAFPCPGSSRTKRYNAGLLGLAELPNLGGMLPGDLKEAEAEI